MEAKEILQRVKSEKPLATIRLERKLTIDRAAVDEEARTVSLAFSSEEPYSRLFGEEILDHSPKSVRMERLKNGAAVLVDHLPRDHVGVIEDASIDADRRGRVVARFGKSARADEVFADVLDGIKRHVSVSYIVHKMVLEEESDDAPSVYRVTDWEPLEVSIVAVPADHTVGVGRSHESTKQKQQPATKELPDMGDEKTSPDVKVDIGKERAEAAEKAAQSTADKYKARAEEVTAFARLYPEIKEIERFLDPDRPLSELHAEGKNALAARNEAHVKPAATDADIGMSEKETKEWSFFRLLRALEEPNDKGRQEQAGFEFECSKAAQDKRDDKKPARGAYMPNEILNRKMPVDDQVRAALMQRGIQVGTDTAGGYLVGSGAQGASFIEYLHNAMMVKTLGAVVLPGLVGDFEVSKLTGGVQYYMVGEDDDVTENNPTFGLVTMKPKTVGALSKLSRKSLLQTSPAVEAITMAEHATSLALGMDYYALHGAGHTSQPVGLASTPGIGSEAMGADGGALSYDAMVDLEGDVVISNAAKPRMASLTTGAVRREMRQTMEHATAPIAKWVWSTTADPLVGEMAGYPAYVSEQVSHTLTKGNSGAVCSALFFGDWTQLWIGEWGSVDVNVDKSTYSSSGALKIVTLQDYDVAVRHPESFAIILDITTA